jgi:ribosomal protein L37AE/L43A
MARHHSDDHPTRNEDEYFARENAELVKKMRERLDAERIAQERQKHYMKCPKCGADLAERAFGQVKVDVCPECDGIWLDKGEMDVLRQLDTSRGAVGRIMSDILGLFQHKSGESTPPSR